MTGDPHPGPLQYAVQTNYAPAQNFDEDGTG